MLVLVAKLFGPGSPTPRPEHVPRRPAGTDRRGIQRYGISTPKGTVLDFLLGQLCALCLPAIRIRNRQQHLYICTSRCHRGSRGMPNHRSGGPPSMAKDSQGFSCMVLLISVGGACLSQLRL